MSSAARMGPIEGTWRSNLVALCLRLSAAATMDLQAVWRLRRTTARNTVTWEDSCNVPRNHSNCVGSIKITIMI